MITRVSADKNGQIIVLPREFRLSAGRVNIRRAGRALIVEPLADDFSRLAALLDEFTDDFMAEPPAPEGHLRA